MLSFDQALLFGVAVFACACFAVGLFRGHHAHQKRQKGYARKHFPAQQGRNPDDKH